MVGARPCPLPARLRQAEVVVVVASTHFQRHLLVVVVAAVLEDSMRSLKKMEVEEVAELRCRQPRQQRQTAAHLTRSQIRNSRCVCVRGL